MAIKKEDVNVAVQKFGKNALDTGSASVQIALLSKRIEALTAHLKKNGEDAPARRSLMTLVGKRHSLLGYLARTDREQYLKLLEQLGLRK